MTTITAAIALARFNYVSTDFDPSSSPTETTSYTNVEYIIDDVIDFVNAEAGTSISNLSGTAGAKTVTVTSAQNSPIKLILSVALKETRYKISTSSTLGPSSLSESVGAQDPLFRKLLFSSLDRLRGRGFERFR